jgi:23S rRNA-/tRNA-specific pseudouridylate synthase
MKEMGHPVIGDKKYGSSVNPIGRTGLHARVLAFIHPITGKEIRYETACLINF